MTRKECAENITEWSELVDFCNENCLSACDDIISDDALDDHVQNMASEGWNRMLCFLSGITYTNDEYYLMNGYGNIENISPHLFEIYKEDALDEFDNDKGFDEDYDDDVCDDD